MVLDQSWRSLLEVEAKEETGGPSPVSDDVSITNAVVLSKSDNVTEHNENENDAEKDDPTKDNDLLSVFSDSEGGKGNRQQNSRSKKGQNRGGPRGGKNSVRGSG